jgi:hypothetical protein
MTNMDQVVVKEVCSRKDLRDFIYLPSRIHKDDPDWLPPIYFDEWMLFNKEKNRSYQYTDAIFYLALRKGKPVGRIMGLVNNRYNQIKNEKSGRFCFVECFNDQEIVHALLEKVEEWVRQKGMVKIVGPLGFSDKDPQGLQIEGFDYPYLFTAATNLPYLPMLLESEGYTKEVDLVNYNVPVPDKLPAIYQKAYDKIIKNREFDLIEFSSKKEIKPYIIPVLELMNSTFSEIYGFVPLNDREKSDFARRYLPIIDPEFIKVVMCKTEPAGFIIGIPDLSAGIIAAGGKFFPFGIYRILKEMKRSKKLLLMLGGVRKEFRGLGLDVLLGFKMIDSAKKRNINLIDSHLILETNTRMRGECERLDGKIVKRFRIYQKEFKT